MAVSSKSQQTIYRCVSILTSFLLQSLLDDFAGHNVDTAAWLVESAGRFLLLLPETAQRMQNMLEVQIDCAL